MQVEPKDEEEVDELAMATEEEVGGVSAASAQDDDERLGSMNQLDEDAEGKEAAATLLQASTSLPSINLHQQSPSPSTS